MFSIKDIEKTMSDPRKSSIFLNRTKERKAEFKNMKHFAKNGHSQKIFENAFTKKMLTVFQTLDAKK